MRFFSLLISLVMPFSISHAQASFKCPIPKNKPTAKDMYAAMQVGTVWTSDFDPYINISFVDKTAIGSEDIKEDYSNWDGVFKIGYYGPNPECRRQLIIEDKTAVDQNGKKLIGVRTGWMAVDVCNPAIWKVAPSIAMIPDLHISDEQKTAVEYVSKVNDPSQLSKRFRVRLSQISFFENKEGCGFKAVLDPNYQGFAGISEEYTWFYHYTGDYESTLYYFDENGTTVSTPTFIGK